MDDLRVPTIQCSVAILLQDGRLLQGVVFLPALSASHAGRMRPEEWINAPPAFFPFRRNDGVGMLLNKSQVLVLTGPCDEPEHELLPDAEMPSRRVVIESAGHRFEGTVVIDMPDNQRRVVDYFNRPEAFVLLRSADGCHLIRKSGLSTVVEQER